MKKLVRVVLSLGVGLAAAVVGVEALLRGAPSLMPEKALLRLHWEELLEDNELRSDADPKLGFRFKPSTTGAYTLKDLSFEYATDEHGFRNPSPWPETAEIVVVGDSLAFGFGAPDDAQWAQLVRDDLEQSRLVNLALPGYCPAQYQASYDEYGAALSPQLLIIGLFPTNDVKDQGKFQNWVAGGAEGNFDVVRFSSGRKAGWLKRTYLAQFVAEYQASRRRGFKSRRIELDDGPLTPVPSQINASAGSSKRGTPEFQSVVETLAGLRRAARGARARVLFLLFPCKEEVYLPGRGIDTPTPTAPFAELCAERNWDHLDLTPILAAGAAREERLYFEIDGHPNVRGNRVIADAVLAWMHENMPTLR